MTRVCLITPGHLSTNPRLVKEADALSGAGYDVSIIAADYQAWARAADREFADRPWRVAERVRFGPMAPPRIRVTHKLRQLSGLALLKLGIELPSVVHAAWHPITPTLVRAALRQPASLYIAHYPAALPAAARAAQRFGGSFAFDAEDYHLGDVPEDASYELQRQMTRSIEGRFITSAAFVTAASPGIADAYVKAYGIVRPTVTLNVFPLADAELKPTPAGIARPGPSLYWFSQTVGPNRGLETAVRAIARAKSKPHLYLRGKLAEGFSERLVSLARENCVAERVHFLDTAGPSELIRLARQYDLGLVGETGDTPNHRISLSNKQFTYLAAGVPAVMSDTPGHAALAPELGNAARLYRVEDPESLSGAIDGLLLNPQILAQARASALDLARTRFNWEREQEHLLGLVAVAMARAARTTSTGVP